MRSWQYFCKSAYRSRKGIRSLPKKYRQFSISTSRSVVLQVRNTASSPPIHLRSRDTAVWKVPPSSSSSAVMLVSPVTTSDSLRLTTGLISAWNLEVSSMASFSFTAPISMISLK